MKILLVNKFYYPKRGAEKYFLFLEQLLRERGHEVRVFAMESNKNLSSPDAKYFSPEIDLHTKSLLGKIRGAKSIIYNHVAKKIFSQLLTDFQPDIIHAHNIYHQISPSILDAARKMKVPVVMHLHDYKLICPNYKLYSKGKYCKKCINGNYWQCTKNLCVDNSFIKSFWSSLEMTVHHKILKIYEKGVTLFIAPSKFMKNICVEAGWSENKFIVLENISPIKKSAGLPLADYLLYFGALEEEKGIDVLIKAMIGTDKQIKIAGEGSYKEKLMKLSKENHVKVDFLGKLEGKDLDILIEQALAVVIPSRWPENMPLAAIEAMSAGKTIIASDIGGLSELIEDKKNGYLFPVNDNQKLKEIILSFKKEKVIEIGQAAAKSRADKNIDWHYKELIKIYEKLINKELINKKSSVF
jgi:glycosyltransferase involved in cell wall biosynthesis